MGVIVHLGTQHMCSAHPGPVSSVTSSLSRTWQSLYQLSDSQGLLNWNSHQEVSFCSLCRVSPAPVCRASLPLLAQPSLLCSCEHILGLSPTLAVVLGLLLHLHGLPHQWTVRRAKGKAGFELRMSNKRYFQHVFLDFCLLALHCCHLDVC